MERYYYKRVDAVGGLIGLFVYNDTRPHITNPLLVEITEAEYAALFEEIKASQEQVEIDPDEISDSEALDIILGGADDEA